MKIVLLFILTNHEALNFRLCITNFKLYITKLQRTSHAVFETLNLNCRCKSNITFHHLNVTLPFKRYFTPAVPDPKNHHSIFTIKTNLSPADVLNFSSVSESDVAELLKSLNIRKATGCDLIPPRALKEGYPSLSRPICSLVNQIITRREIPSIWKHGEVLHTRICTGPAFIQYFHK